MLNEAQIRACSQYVLQRARYVIETFGPRPPGSVTERRTQELVKADLEASCDGPVTFEEFRVAQKAFFAMQAVGGALTLAAIALYWVHPAIALLLALTSATVMYNQLLRYRQFLDPFFPKKPSYNVAGRQRPSQRIERRVILNAHPDAAYEWRFNFLAPKWFPLLVLYTLVSLVALLLGAAIATTAVLVAPAVASELGHWIGIALLALAPAGVVGILFNNFGVVAGGANDNLTGTFVAVGILRALRDAGLSLERTELVAVITGSEEAGLRGAKVWSQQHNAECRDVETIVISLETFGDLPFLAVYSRDMNSTVALDAGVCDLLKRAARATGRDLPYASVHLGSSDAAAFAQAGFRAAMLGGMDPHPAHYYHNRRDSWENMSEECVRAAVEVLIEAIRTYDEEGLRVMQV